MTIDRHNRPQKNAWNGNIRACSQFFGVCLLFAPVVAPAADPDKSRPHRALPSRFKEARNIEQLTVRGATHHADPFQSEDVLSGASLVTHNVHNVFGLQYLTPSLQVTPQFSSGQPGYTIRGLGFNDYASNNASAVGITIDGVAQTIPFLTGGLMSDIAQVSILRGPQGYDGGRSVSAGLVNYRTIAPEAKPAAGASVQYGRFGALTASGWATGQLAPRLISRVSLQTQQGGAWQIGPAGTHFGQADQYTARATSQLQVSDTTLITLDLHGTLDRSDGTGLHRFTPLTTMYNNGRGPVLPADSDRRQTWWGTDPSYAKLAHLNPDQRPFHHVSSGGFVLTARKKMQGAELIAVTGFDAGQRHEYDNFGAATAPVAGVTFNTRANTIVQSLTLASTTSQRLHWKVGLWFNRQVLAEHYISGFAASYGFNRSVSYQQTGLTLAGFANLQYELSKNVTLLGGMRLDGESRTLHDFRAYTYRLAGDITNPDNRLAKRDLSYILPTGFAAVEYRPYTHLKLYASIKRGMKSGGFTAYNSTNVATSTTPFQPEQLWAYEVGGQASFPKLHLQAEISAFYDDLYNEQVQSAILDPTIGLLGAIVNAPRAHMAGGEFNLHWSPLPGLLVTQGGGWAVGRYDRFLALFSATKVNNVFVGTYQNRAGTHLPAPKLTLTGSISYQFHIDRWQVTPGLNYALRSTYHSLFGTLYNVAGYTIFGANLTVRPPASAWTIAFYGDNIFNKQYDVDRNFFLAGDNVALAGMPSTWGGRIACSF